MKIILSKDLEEVKKLTKQIFGKKYFKQRSKGHSWEWAYHVQGRESELEKKVTKGENAVSLIDTELLQISNYS